MKKKRKKGKHACSSCSYAAACVPVGRREFLKYSDRCSRCWRTFFYLGNPLLEKRMDVKCAVENRTNRNCGTCEAIVQNEKEHDAPLEKPKKRWTDWFTR